MHAILCGQYRLSANHLEQTLAGPFLRIRGKTNRSSCRYAPFREDGVASITTDIVDAYVFRHRQGRAQFLLLRRRAELPLGNTWHGIHGRVAEDETSLEAARRAIRIQTGLANLAAFSADYINQFFDHATDTIVLAPVFAFQLMDDFPISLDDEFDDYAWCDRDEATGRLIFAGQRWAVRHIEDIVANPVADSDFYRLP